MQATGVRVQQDRLVVNVVKGERTRLIQSAYPIKVEGKKEI